MSQDRRKLEKEAMDLIAAAKEDGPSDAQQHKARVALGLAAPVAPLAPPPGAESAASATASTAAASSGAAASSAIAVKAAWAIVAVTVASGTGWLALEDSEPKPAAVSTSAEPPKETIAPAPSVSPPALEAPSVPPQKAEPPTLDPRPAPRRQPVVPKATKAPERAPSSTPDDRPSTLQREIVLLKKARSAFESNDFDLARSVLSEYRREIEGGALAEEADALRVDVAFATNAPNAEVLAKAFLSSYPSSPHAARMRARLEAP